MVLNLHYIILKMHNKCSARVKTRDVKVQDPGCLYITFVIYTYLYSQSNHPYVKKIQVPVMSTFSSGEFRRQINLRSLF